MDRARDSRAGRRPAVARRLRAWLRPPRTLRPTRAGWSFFAISFGVGFAALNTGNNLLYLVLSLMLAFLVLSGLLSEAALRGIRVRRRLPREIFAGGQQTVALELTNEQRRFASFAIVVEDRLRDDAGDERPAGRVFALRIAAGASEQRFYRLAPERRGRLQLTGFQVYTRFPFGLFSKALRLAAPEEALVYPAIEPLRVVPELGSARGGGESRSGPGGQGAEVSGLREFAPGDSMRRIHWRASLRRGGLLVRRLESEHEAEVEVQLHTAAHAPGPAFEERVSWAASEVIAHLEAGYRVALRTDSERLAAESGGAQRSRLLSFLATVRAERPAPARAA